MPSGSSSKRSTDPFWDKVIAAHDSVAIYPDQTIEISVDDSHAKVWHNPKFEGIVWVKTWVATEKEEVENA